MLQRSVSLRYYELCMKKLQPTCIFFVFLFVFLFSVPESAFMQSTNLGLTSGSIQIQMTPSNPRPGQTVTLSLNTFSIDVERSNISWYENGSLVSSGLGVTSFSSTAGNIGSTKTVRVVVQQTGTSPIEKTVSIRPADILLLWQADSYTPPFYKGKALHATEGNITVFALPDIIENGTRVSKNALIFTWEKDGVVLGSKSGVGRDTLFVEGSILTRPVTISVEVETVSGNTKAKRSIEIPITGPSVALYEHHPTLGVLFNRALSETTQLHSEETVIEAFPYFFSSDNRSPELSYEWRLGGKLVENVGTPYIIVRQGNESGSETLSVSTKNQFSLFESSGTHTTITF